jgi:hypothetical protein
MTNKQLSQLTFDEQIQLVERKLATVSINGNLSTFKYAKKVMYNYMWNDYPELKKCRGHTYNYITKEIVTIPPDKTFNYLENNTWFDMPLDTKVFAYKKYNGFMASCSIYNGKLVVSTTGSTKSDYAHLAYSKISPVIQAGNNSGITWLFEICDESDPHIIDERYGAHYLGYTLHKGEGSLRFIPTGGYIDTTLGEMLELSKHDKGEGFMLYTDNYQCCKLKTDYYIGKKILMSMSRNNVDKMYNNKTTVIDKLPSRWKHSVSLITSEFRHEEWRELPEQQRRTYLESIEL